MWTIMSFLATWKILTILLEVKLAIWSVRSLAHEIEEELCAIEKEHEAKSLAVTEGTNMLFVRVTVTIGGFSMPEYLVNISDSLLNAMLLTSHQYKKVLMVLPTFFHQRNIILDPR